MAAAKFACPSCQTVLQLSQAPPPGAKIRCPRCSAVFSVRVPATASVITAQPAAVGGSSARLPPGAGGSSARVSGPTPAATGRSSMKMRTAPPPPPAAGYDEERPRPKAKKRGSDQKVIAIFMGLGALLFIVALVVIVVLLIRPDSGKQDLQSEFEKARQRIRARDTASTAPRDNPSPPPAQPERGGSSGGGGGGGPGPQAPAPQLPPDTPISNRSDSSNPFLNLNVGAWPVRGPRDLEGMRYLPERAEVVQFADFSSAHLAPELADWLTGLYLTPDLPGMHPLRKLLEIQPPATLDYVLSAGRFGNVSAALSNPAQSGSATEYATTLFYLRKAANQERIVKALKGEPGPGVPGFTSYRLPSFNQGQVAQSAFLLFPEADDRIVIVAQSVKDDVTAVVGSSGSMNTAMQNLLGSLEPNHFWMAMSLDSFRPLLMLATSAAGANLPPEFASDLKPVLNEIPRARGIIVQARLQESVLRASLGLSFDSPGPAGTLSNSLASLWSNKLKPTLAGADAQSKVAGDVVKSLRFAVRGYGVHMSVQVTVPALAADYPMMAEAIRSLPAMALRGASNLPNPGAADFPSGAGTDTNSAPGAASTSSANPEPMAPAAAGSGSSPSTSGLVGRSLSNPNAPFGVEVGLRAPDIEGTDAEGKPIRLSQFKGKIIALDFWGYWCPPCRSMIPHERELVEKLRDEPFVFVGVNTDARGHFQSERKKEPITWRNFMDGQRGPICRKYKIEAFPTILLIDANGVIRHKFVGVPPKGVLDKAIDELIAELKGG